LQFSGISWRNNQSHEQDVLIRAVYLTPLNLAAFVNKTGIPIELYGEGVLGEDSQFNFLQTLVFGEFQAFQKQTVD
jgi:hypothetical protein